MKTNEVINSVKVIVNDPDNRLVPGQELGGNKVLVSENLETITIKVAPKVEKPDMTSLCSGLKSRLEPKLNNKKGTFSLSWYPTPSLIEKIGIDQLRADFLKVADAIWEKHKEMA